MSVVLTNYPVNLSIDFPDRPLNRLTSFFRLFTAIPIVIIVILLTQPYLSSGEHSVKGWHMALSTGGFVVLPVLLMILFRKKYPKWWYDWNLAFWKFTARCSSYIYLLRDEYPSTDEEQAVHLEMSYPDGQNLMRGMPLVKWFLAIPHYVILIGIAVAVVVSWIIAWFAILFTGRYPRGLFDFILGYMRWEYRVLAYAFLMITDEYPPFSLNA